jgi:hypothetical protein
MIGRRGRICPVTRLLEGNRAGHQGVAAREQLEKRCLAQANPGLGMWVRNPPRRRTKRLTQWIRKNFGRRRIACWTTCLITRSTFENSPCGSPSRTRGEGDFATRFPGYRLIATVHEEFMRVILPFAAGNVHPGFMGWVQGGGTPVRPKRGRGRRHEDGTTVFVRLLPSDSLWDSFDYAGGGAIFKASRNSLAVTTAARRDRILSRMHSCVCGS